MHPIGSRSDQTASQKYLLSGLIAFSGGGRQAELTEARPGRVLRSARDTYTPRFG